MQSWAEWRARHDLEPLFQVRILRSRSYSVGAAVGFCFQLAVGGDSTGKELGVAFGVSVLGSIFLALMFGRVVNG